MVTEGRKKAVWRYTALQRLINAFTACSDRGRFNLLLKSQSCPGIQIVSAFGQRASNLRNIIDVDSMQPGLLRKDFLTSKLIFETTSTAQECDSPTSVSHSKSLEGVRDTEGASVSIFLCRPWLSAATSKLL